MEKVNCVLCNLDDYELVTETKDLRYGLSQDIFKIVKCRNCGLVFLNPRTTENEIGKFYSVNYYDNAVTKFENIFCDFLNRAKLNRIQKYKKKGRILDIGCGNGDFLSIFSPDKWELYGIEPNPIGYALTNRQFKVNKLNKTLRESKFPTNFFDVITLWHVLEHIYDPNEELREVSRILKEDGILAISVPNINSFGFKICKNRWFHLDSPRHHYHYDPETIRKVLNKNGFQFFRINFLCFEFPLDLYHSLISAFDRKKFIRVLFALPILLLSLIIKSIAHPFKICETMEVFSNKNKLSKML